MFLIELCVNDKYSKFSKLYKIFFSIELKVILDIYELLKIIPYVNI